MAILKRAQSTIYGLETDLSTIITGAGLAINGVYSADGTADYISGATSLAHADSLLDDQIKVNADGLATAATERSTLQSNIDSEEADRIAGDTTLQSNIDSEEAARIAADTTLTTDLATEVARATAAESTLIADLAAEVTNRIADVDAEEAARIAGDTTLQSNIDAEVAARTTAVSDLDAATLKKADNLSDLTDVAAARTNLGVYSSAEVDDAITTAGLNLGTNFSVADNTAKDGMEAGSLSVGDNVFVTDDGDGNWAIYKVTAVTDGAGSTSMFEKIMDEDVYLNAISADAIKASYESNADTNAFTDEDWQRVDRMGDSSTVLDTTATEVFAAINELHSDGLTLQANIDSEEADRIAADATLQSNIDAEVTNRIADVDAEEARALAAETTLAADLATEVARATAAESTLIADLAAEVTNRIADVEAEETRALAAEAALQSELNDTQVGAGLGTDGSYTANASSNYMQTATSLVDADDKLDAAVKALDDDTYSKAEVDQLIAAGGAVFITDTLTVSSDQIVLTQAPKNGEIFNFATVRHYDVSTGVSYDIPVTVDVADTSGKTFTLHPDTSGDFDTKSVQVQYAYVPTV